MNDGSIQNGDVFSKFGKTVVCLEMVEESWSCAAFDGTKYNGPITILQRTLYSDYTFESNIFEL